VTWFRVDDSFSDHAKVVSLLERRNGLRAVGLWTLCGSWSSKHERDGFVPSAMVKRHGATMAEASLLVEVGLWHDVDGGYQFHGWDERNPLKSALDERRNAVTERQRRHRSRAANAHVTRDTDESVTRDEKVLQRDVTRSQTLPRPFPDPRESESAPAAAPTPTNRPEPEPDRGAGLVDFRAAGTVAARPDPVDRVPEPEQGFNPRRMQVAFIAEYEAVQRSTPNMGGKHVGELHATVLRTAELQRVDPSELFVAKVRTWLSKPLSERERQSPYACFAQAWGSLTAAQRRDVTKGFVEPAPASAFTNPTNLDDVFGPEIPLASPQPERFPPRRRSAT
jgi:hypothetical protein